jgi:hypothetical protein
MTMKTWILNAVGLAAIVYSASGCAMATGGNAGAMGSLYSSYQGPGAIGTGDLGAKTGEACVTSILGIVATGDASISTAAKAGGITKVSHVDHDNFGILGIYAKTCTHVKGN